MQRIHALTLLVAIGLSASGCKVIARQIVAYRDSWDNGLTKREGRLDNGVQTGEWTFCYESGQRRAKGRYEDDHQVGPWTYYYENGVTEWSGAFDSTGRRTGEWTFHYPDDTLRARGVYVADLEEGAWEFFAEDGLLARSGQYDNGKLSGPWRYFHPGGELKAEGLCHRGQRIGPWSVFDAAGRKATQDFPTKAGIQVVQEKWPNGTVRRTGVTHNGAPVGRWTCYHDNGKPRFSCTMAQGRATGVFDARAADGNLIAQGVLQEGRFVEGAIAMQNRQSRPIAPGPVPLPTPAPTTPGNGEWASAAALAAMPAESAVGVLVVEVGSVVEPVALSTVVRNPPQPDSIPVATVQQVVQQIEELPERVPAPVQPDLTVTQREELKDYVLNYLKGLSKSRPSRNKYGPATTEGRAPGSHRRTELEGRPLPVQVLHGVDGRDVDLRQYRGKNRLLIVILRGYVGEVCVYCVAQTEALGMCRDRLRELGIEVFVIYPGSKENEASFEKAYAMAFGKDAPPYRVSYDPDLEVVQQLGIVGELAFPTTLIVDEAGIVQYAYVGEHRADRPAAEDLIKRIEGMQ